MNLLRAIIVTLVALSALPARAATVAVYGTNNDVRAINVTNSTNFPEGTSILRNGFYEPGDSPETHYWLRRSNCLINGGAGDDGVEIKPTTPAADVCWVANTPQTNPLVWGAKCDGTNDDTGAIQKAIDYAQTYIDAAQSAGTTIRGSVVMPAGKLCLTSGLTISGPIDFGGAGRYDGRLQAVATTTAPVIKITPTYQPAILNRPYPQVRIHNLQMKGAGCSSCTDIGQHGIHITTPTSQDSSPTHMLIRVEDVEIYSNKGAGVSAVGYTSFGAVTLVNVAIWASYNGVAMSSNFDWTIQSLKVSGSQNHALSAAAPVNLTCIDCQLFTSKQNGVHLYDDGQTATNGNITFFGGAIDYNENHGFYWEVHGGDENLHGIAVNLIGTKFTSNGRPWGCNGTNIGEKSDLYFAPNTNINGLKLDNTVFNYAPHVPGQTDCHHTAKYNIEFDSGVIGSLSLNSYFATSLDKAISHPDRIFGSSTSYITDGQFFNYEVKTLTASTTFTPRANLVEASVVLFGCGGGGGSGGAGASGVAVSGGGGGGGGARADGRFTGAVIGANRPITICSPGGGGLSSSAGTAGGSTLFSNLLVAPGGGGGAGGASGTGSGGGAGGGAFAAGGSGSGATAGTGGVGSASGGSGTIGSNNTTLGGGGGGGSRGDGTGAGGGGAAPYGGGGGGGSGGGITIADDQSLGGNSGAFWTGAVVAATGGAACSSGQSGYSSASGAYDKGGSGGAGGGACATAAAGAGGAGGFPGGGGGGGGASRTGFAGGAGGVGGGGVAVIVSKYAN